MILAIFAIDNHTVGAETKITSSLEQSIVRERFLVMSSLCKKENKMDFSDIKVGDKLTWVTEGLAWINGERQERTLKFPAEVVEVSETTFTCKTTDVYYLYKCNKSDGVAVGQGRDCGWAEKVNLRSKKPIEFTPAKFNVAQKNRRKLGVS